MNREKTPLYKPLFWSLFAAGGMIAALALPALVLIFSLMLPLDLLADPISFYGSLHGFAANFFGRFLLAAVLFVMLWHCCHRFYYCMHDVKVHMGFAFKCVLYGLPVAAFLLVMIAGC